MTRAQTSSGKTKPATASAVSTVVRPDPTPARVASLEVARRVGGELEDCLDRRRREHPTPRRRQGQGALRERGQEPQRVHLERRRVGDALEAIGRDVVGPADVGPPLVVRDRQPEDGPDDLAEHRPEVGAGSLGRGPWRRAASGRRRSRR